MLSMTPREHVVCVGTPLEAVSAHRFSQKFDLRHGFAALAYRKRRRHHTSAGRQKSMLSETEVGLAVGYNVERPV